jgi:hypothetical protein
MLEANAALDVGFAVRERGKIYEIWPPEPR